jgi:hypothetical protein
MQQETSFAIMASQCCRCFIPLQFVGNKQHCVKAASSTQLLLKHATGAENLLAQPGRRRYRRRKHKGQQHQQ